MYDGRGNIGGSYRIPDCFKEPKLLLCRSKLEFISGMSVECRRCRSGRAGRPSLARIAFATIHVSDLADIHVLALCRLQEGGDSFVANCGYGRGYSVREVLSAVERIHGRPLNVREASRRPGDPPALVADTSRLARVLGWRPRSDALDDIISTALAWERRFANVKPAFASDLAPVPAMFAT
jgi:nucleoside-diphosphate-sugar epimerase